MRKHAPDDLGRGATRPFKANHVGPVLHRPPRPEPETRPAHRHGRSLLNVEQRIDLVLRVCDRTNVMVGGRIVLEEEASTVDRDERAIIDAHLG